jgi:phage FluMu gp28-like protein
MTQEASDPQTWLEARRENSEDAIALAIGTERNEARRLERALLPYQQQAIRLRRAPGVNVLVIEKSRRVGLTWGMASDAVLQASKAKKRGGSDWLYISYSRDMTREFIDACAMWAKIFQLAATQAEEFIFEDEKEGEDTRSIQAFRIRFASGFEIVGLSSAPRALRGQQGVVMIDEAAFVDSLKELMKSALALNMWGGQVILCSTHNGTDNEFNQIITDVKAGRKDYALMHVDLREAMAQGLFKRICLVNRKPWSDEAEKQWFGKIVADYGDAADEELFCVPSQGSGTWLTTELIERQMQRPATILRWTWPKDYLNWDESRQGAHLRELLAELDRIASVLNPKRRHALGFDFARVTDLSVAHVLSITPELRRESEITIEMRNAPHAEQLAIVDHLWGKLPNPAGGAFDAGGGGSFVAEGMARRHGAYDLAKAEGGKIAEIRFSTEWYRLNMPRVKAAFEDGTLILHKDADHLGDLRLVRLVRGIAQVPDLRTGTQGLKRHGDFAIALVLAYFATLMNTIEYGYAAAPSSDSNSSDSFNTPPSARDQGGDRWPEPLGRQISGRA